MISLVLWPTSRCNLQCQYCYAAGVKGAEMSSETLQKALELPGEEPFKVQIAGGEPLCNPEMVEEILQRAYRCQNCKGVSIQTNATLIRDPIAALFAKYRVAIGVSLDGRPEINEAQRGKTRQAVHGIQVLARHGLCANLTCVVTAYNAPHLAELAEFACYLGNIRGIGLDLLRTAGRAQLPGKPQTQPVDPEVLKSGLDALCRRLEQLNHLLPPQNRIVLREEKKALAQMQAKHPCRDYCYAAQGKSYVVLPNGDCYPCGSLTEDKRYCMGNVHHTIHPIEIHAAWPKACRSCEYAAFCTGGCPSRGLLSGGFDPLDCVVKKYMFQRNKQLGGKI